MSTLKKRNLLIKIILAILVLLIFYLNSIMSPVSIIRNRFLHDTPIGTDMNDVIKYVKRHKKWTQVYVSDEYGYVDDDRNEIGSKSVGACIGAYYVPFEMSVTVEWGFDDESKLVDIYVWKSMDVW